MSSGSFTTGSFLVAPIVLVATCSLLCASASEQKQGSHSAPPVPVVQWQFDTGGTISTEPVVSGELVFVASDAGKIYAIKKETADEVWTYDSRVDGMAIVRGGPLLYNDTVIVGRTEQSCSPNQHGFVYSLEQRTGKLRWTTAVPGIQTNFAKMEDTAIFGTRHDEWISIDLQTGKREWKFSASDSDDGCYENSLPATDGVNIVVSAHGRRLFGLDGSGRKVWEKRPDVAVSTNLFVYKDVAYFGATNGHIYGVNPATGQALVELPTSAIPLRGFTWGGEHDEESEYSFGSIERDRNKRNVLLAYADGFERVLWSHELESEGKCETPYYWQGLVLVGDCNGHITAYRANDGLERWSAVVKGCIRTLAGDKSSIFVGTEEGALYRLRYSQP